MRLTGNAKVSGAVRQADSNSSTNGWNLDGTLGLENLRLNQLKVFKKLEGTFEVGRDMVYVWLHWMDARFSNFTYCALLGRRTGIYALPLTGV